MEFINYYFGQHKEKHLLYFVGSFANANTLISLLQTTSLEECLLYFEDNAIKDEYLEELNNKLEERDLSILKCVSKNEINASTAGGKVFVFDGFANSDEMSSFAKLKPSKVVGYFFKEFNTFRLWECLKEHCDHIVLSRDFDEYKCETLTWDKNPETDIELSVVLPVYNVASYLEKCYQSISAWKAPYIEFVFVSDGSPDNSEEIIKEFAKKDKRVKLLVKPNGGCASARQYGIDHSKGRYIGLIDPDDFVEPDMFKKLLSRAMTGTYDIAYSGYYEYYEESGTSQAIEDVTGKPYSDGTSDPKLIDDLIAYRRVAIWRGVYRREFLENNNIRFYEDLKRFDDLPFKVETFARAKSVVSIDEPLYYYRMGRPGQDVSANDERIFIHFDIFNHLDEFFKNYRSSLQLRHYYQVKVQTHFWGIGLLKPEFKKDYIKKASQDLKIKCNASSWKKVLKKYYRKNEVNNFISENKRYF